MFGAEKRKQKKQARLEARKPVFRRVMDTFAQANRPGNIIDYAICTTASFAQKPFCSVDSLIFAELSYLQFSSIAGQVGDKQAWLSLAQLPSCGDIEQLVAKSWLPLRAKTLVHALALNPRFKNVTFNYAVDIFREDIEEQFAAITFCLGDGSFYIGFRGTDTSYIGWKEDFNLLYSDVIPAQHHAEEYLTAIAGLEDGLLRVGGHSKGGNLAEFASIFCRSDIQERICQVYNHDGPGFKDDLTVLPEFQRISSRFIKEIPQSSIFGLMLQGHSNYRVVVCDHYLLTQHLTFSWRVQDGDFVDAEDVDGSSRLIEGILTDWYKSIDETHRRYYIDAMYEIFKALDSSRLEDFSPTATEAAKAFFKARKEIDLTTQLYVWRTLALLGLYVPKNVLGEAVFRLKSRMTTPALKNPKA